MLGAIADISIDEGLPFTIQAQRSDQDFPAQELTYSLLPGAPAGVELDAVTGELTWVPAEQQGPGTYTIGVAVIDDGEPAMTATRSFQATVRDINNAPVIEPISDQSVSEGTAFTMEVVAADPDIPAARLTFALESAPEGMSIHPDTGVIAWTPGEAAGPRDHSVVVLVSEPGGTPNATASFVIGVHEVNSPPVLEALPDMIVGPGDFIAVTNRASDSDLPEQVLSFSASGLPSGANLDPTTGVLSWLVPDDPPAGTNLVGVRVSDDATPSASADQNFRIIVKAPPRVAINEIMHRAAIEGGEYVELANISQFNSVDISGWRLEGYNFTFPPNTILPPSSYLCVARFMTGFVGSYGPEPRFIGDAVVTIAQEGGVVRLVRPAAGGDEIIDEVEFSQNPPWPSTTPGVSLQLIDPWEDNRRVNNWAASVQAGANSTSTVIPIGATWRYWQQETAPAPNWIAPEFSDAAWPSGDALLYVEGSALPAAKAAPLTLGNTVYYFRGRFNFSGYTNGATLRFNTVIDDGAIFYLNGEELFRLGMEAGVVDESTFADRVVANAVFEGPFEVPALGLRTGENVIAARVHQANSGSSDIVFGAEVELTTTTPVSHTPGAPNSVGRDRPGIPPIWINEVHPLNTTGITDGSGEREGWFELHNSGAEPVDLGGWFITDDLSQLNKHAIPPNVIIPARGFALFWADAETAPGELHVPFRLGSEGGILVLSVPIAGADEVVHYVNYSASANESFGLVQDGNPIQRSVLGQASPGAANGSFPAVRPRLGVERSASGALRINWSSIAGTQYTVEGCDNLATAAWRTLWNGPGSGGELSYEEMNGQTHRFYRVRSQ